ncbi:MAG: hypothetical protein F6K24_54795 [Okeania sp. SIO2D1]|nr:hypothetical protein [Okeania sp. SIO2D1]
MNIKEFVDKIIEDGKISRREYEEFLLKVNEDNKIDFEETLQIKRLRNLIEKNQLKVE